MTAHVALLRGINLGPHNRLPMKDLAALFAAAGAKSVQTFINSGNVLFIAAPRAVPKIGRDVSAAVEERFGFEAPIVFRTSAELQKVVRAIPFDDDAFVHVTFLADRPKKAQVAVLETKRAPSESFVANGRELYLRLPKGVGQTKLVAAFVDRTLGTVATTRNWRTVTKLAELSAALA